jgi:ABC-type uncharacterized transport system auxiliary subunit
MSTRGKKYYYQLHVSDADSNTVWHGSKMDSNKKKILLVEAVEVEEIFNDYRIVYRTSPYQINYYSYHYWVKKPEKIIRDFIYTFCTKSKFFNKIIMNYSEGEPDWLLTSKVSVMEEVDHKEYWYARLNMQLELKEFKTGESIISHSFDRRERLLNKRVEYVPMVISSILKSELEVLLNKLIQ